MKHFNRVVGVSAAALVTVGSLSLYPAHSEPSNDEKGLARALAKTSDSLTTPFEDSDGAKWTTYEQSLTFNRQLAASTDRVSVTNVGTSTQGRKIQRVAVGHPAPQDAAKAVKGSTAMVVCSIHGNEPSGRESCLKLARDLALSKDPAVTRFLKTTTVLFLHANPDGWVANTRGNATGADLNRDYMAAEQPETQAVLKTIRDWKPDILNDLHEYGARPDYDTDLLHLWPRNRNTDQGVYRYAKKMSQNYASAQVVSQGYTSGVYGQLVRDGKPYLQVAGDSQARILRNYAGLVNVVGMLSETAANALTPEEKADPNLLNRRRVDVNLFSAVGSLQLVQENRKDLIKVTAGAETRQQKMGADQKGIIYFGGQDDMVPTESKLVEPAPMCGYRLTAEQFAKVKKPLALHGIASSKVGADRMVSMAQAQRGLIPQLLDGRYEFKLVDGTPMKSC
ncbi:M14 family zinc carboxypeptidase [Demetria terragena]|uniref:M14 family zinc carboxypeptidase n=1 Tax=Demetria terragena TaxID=63959 RepID=UPI00037DB098|nr:M14 family zinc carboxypeptidase [Demetria terragena]